MTPVRRWDADGTLRLREPWKPMDVSGVLDPHNGGWGRVYFSWLKTEWTRTYWRLYIGRIVMLQFMRSHDDK